VEALWQQHGVEGDGEEVLHVLEVVLGEG